MPANYAFNQTGPREFLIQDVDGNSLKPGQELTCYTYPQLQQFGKVSIVDIAVGLSVLGPSPLFQHCSQSWLLICHLRDQGP